ncbi:Cation-independent mannose-6-phosphate receptor CI-MPR [Lecanora helva]
MRHHLPAALLALLSSTAYAADSKETKPCQVYNPTNGKFYDLNPITVQPLQDHKKAHKDDRTESWHARGYDYETNFTLNFCAPVIEKLEDVVGVKEELWKNVSAFYRQNDKTYSIGQASSEPIFRGRKLLLNYTDGSPCDSSSPRLLPRKLKDHDDDDDDDDEDHDDRKHDKSPSHKEPTRRKSSLITFACEHDSLAAKAHLSFLGASPDECTYFFEARSTAACGGAIAPQQSLGPGGVFGVIALIAAAVYVLGGIAYQRTVMHQRGWRQLPNYNLWAGIFGFVSVSNMRL